MASGDISANLFRSIPILRKQFTGTSGMDKEDIVFGLIESIPDTAHQTSEGLAGAAGIQNDALQTHDCSGPHRAGHPA